MNRKKSCSITGINGFLGNSLNRRLTSLGWQTFPVVRPDVGYLFLFGSPSSNHWFNHALGYSLRETIDNFLSALEYCREHNIKLIYPSSGTIPDGKTPYSKCKLILEILASIYSKNVLGLRIFAAYGEGEGHKQEYASIVYSFIKDIKEGKSPIIWGDGKQTRDFIYIEDVIDNIVKYRDKEGVIEIGTGVNRSFNEVVKIINKKLKTNIKPIYKKRPKTYIQDTICKDPCKYKVSLEEGIQKIIDSM